MTDTTSATPSGGRKGRSKTPGDPALALEDLVLCSRRIANGLDEVFEKNNVSFEEWSVIKGLIGRDDVPVREAARSAGIARQQFRKLLGTLQQKGLILSKTPPGGDRKQSTIAATPRAAALRPVISGELQQLLGEGGDKNGQIFVRAAARLARIERSLRKKTMAAKGGGAKGDDDDDDD